ncbi:hypothetical protein BJV78DRAFT_1158205 [Lactifluus subvellereus]|nr:hypothetical protein BJV78DRAFT_1158205 [Lactifluus subvellereus]
MSDMTATRKQPKTKVGVVKRFKELALHRAEVVEDQRKRESVTATEGESWDVKKAIWMSLVCESENMVRDTTTRLEGATREPEDLLTSAKRNAEQDQDRDGHAGSSQ